MGGFEVERYTVIRGVVPGATSQAPIVTIAIQIRGQDLIIPAAIAPLTGEDILLNMDSINQLFRGLPARRGQRMRGHVISGLGWGSGLPSVFVFTVNALVLVRLSCRTFSCVNFVLPPEKK